VAAVITDIATPAEAVGCNEGTCTWPVISDDAVSPLEENPETGGTG